MKKFENKNFPEKYTKDFQNQPCIFLIGKKSRPSHYLSVITLNMMENTSTRRDALAEQIKDQTHVQAASENHPSISKTSTH